MSIIYHLTPSSRWNTWPKDEDYYPSDLEKDGFIHCTAGDELMIRVANRFCRTLSGDFLILFIDTKKLRSEVKWERATDIDADFPHIYGLINKDAVVDVQKFDRAADGTFLGWSKIEESHN